MKAGILTGDEKLKEEIARNAADSPEEEWAFYDRADEAFAAVRNETFDYFIISDRFFDYEGLSEWVENAGELQPAMKIIVLLSNRHDARVNEQFLKLCLSLGLRFVLPGRTLSGVAQSIRECVGGRPAGPPQSGSANRLIVFVGTTPNIGTTLVCFGIAVRLALMTEQRVGYLCLNLKSSKLHRYLGRDEPRATLDGMRADLKALCLTPERLLQYCESVREAPRLRVLFGNQIREQAEYFTPEEIEHLLDVATEAFDVCIVDTSAYWDNAATVCSLMRADRRIAVTTQELAHFQEDLQRWLKTVAPLFGISPSSFDLIVTQVEKGTFARGIRVKDIRRETQMPIIGEIGMHSNVRDVLNEGRLMEMLTGSNAIAKELADVCGKLVTLCGFAPAPAAPRRLKGGRWRLGTTGNV
jgi:MinD-like ATPase involved in chromosome partitioning or flagellar assembly